MSVYKQGDDAYWMITPNHADGFVTVRSYLANNGYLTIYNQSGKTIKTMSLPQVQPISGINTHDR